VERLLVNLAWYDNVEGDSRRLVANLSDYRQATCTYLCGINENS
jgi:hypothetical protein